MARSCELWVAAFFVGWLFPALVVESADLPKEAAALIEAHEAEVEKLRQTFAGQLNEWRHDLIKELKLVQKQLAEKELLDEAILVRNLVRTLEAEANSESTTPVPVEQFQKLPKEAQKLLLARESPGAVKNRLEKDGSAKLAALLKSLMELQTALTKNDKLDEAVAVRDWIRRNTPVGQLPPPRKKVPAEIP